MSVSKSNRHRRPLAIRLLTTVLSVSLLFGAIEQTHAQTKPLPPDKAGRLLSPELTTDRKLPPNQGWKRSVTFSSSIAFAHSSRMVGAQDGQTWNIGPSLDASLDYWGGAHEWRNTLYIREVFTRTPVIDEFVKTVDQARLDTLYLYHIESLPWLGPYVQLKAETSFFPGEDVRDKPTTYQIKGEDETFEASRLSLTKAFAPTRLKQVLGLFASPLSGPALALEFRLGVGAQQILVRDGLIIEDKKTTPTIELRRMHDFQQIGTESTVSVDGTWVYEDEGQKRSIEYGLTATGMMPLVSSRQDGRPLHELFELEVNAKLRFRLVRWASIDYNFRLIRAPLIVDEIQLQNDVVLNFSYTMTP